MPQQQQFGYTPVSSGINTTPLVTQAQAISQPGMYFNNKSKAASDIESIMNAALQVGKVYGEYKQEQNKINQNEANLQLLNVKLDHQEKLNSLNDNDVEGYKQLTNSYRTKSDDILSKADLNDESRLALTTSITETAGMFNNHVTKAVKIIENKQATEGVTAAIANLHNAPVDDNTRVVFNGLKETLKATGKTDIEVEDFLARQYLSTKLSTIDKDNTSVAEMNSLLKNSDEFIKSNISSNMINKEVHSKFKDVVSKFKDGLIREEVHKFSQYAENDDTSLKSFKVMLQEGKANGSLDNITYDNLLQKKTDRIEANNIRAESKRLSQLNKEAKDVMFAIKDPSRTLEEKQQLLVEGQKKGLFSSNEARYLMASEQEEVNKSVNIKVVDQMKQEVEIAKVSGNIPPDAFEAKVILTNKVITKEDFKTIEDYRAEYDVKNRIGTGISVFQTNKIDMIKQPGYDGFKKGVNEMTTNFYNDPSKFNATGITEIYNRHELKGNIEIAARKELSNPTTAINAVMKFTQINNVDSVAAKAIYGDTTYSMLSALSNQAIPDPTYKGSDKSQAPLIIPENVMDLVHKKMANPKDYKLPEDVNQYFKDKVKEQPQLLNQVESLKLTALLDSVNYKTHVESSMKEIEIKQQVPNFDVARYPGKVRPEDKPYMEHLVKIAQKHPEGVGISYDPKDKLFYWSNMKTQYGEVITRTNEKGYMVPIRDLTELLSIYGKGAAGMSNQD